MKTFNYGNEFNVGGNSFYPVHLSIDELSIILDEFISKVGDITYLSGFVRKTMAKGIEYKVLLSNKKITDVNSTPTNKEYSIVILPNWKIEIMDHWLSLNLMPRCENIPSDSLSEFVFKQILSRKDLTDEITVNPIFKSDEWRILRKISDVGTD